MTSHGVAAQAVDEVESLAVRVEVARDGSIKVRERIRVRSASVFHHGLVRYYATTRRGPAAFVWMQLPFEVRSATLDGTPTNFRAGRQHVRRYLPHAIALGVDHVWARRFGALLSPPGAVGAVRGPNAGWCVTPAGQTPEEDPAALAKELTATLGGVRAAGRRSTP